MASNLGVSSSGRVLKQPRENVWTNCGTRDKEETSARISGSSFGCLTSSLRLCSACQRHAKVESQAMSSSKGRSSQSCGDEMVGSTMYT